MRVVVTGGLGTIGRRLLPELLDAGHEVTCFEMPTRANMRAARQFPRVRMQFGDIRSPEEVSAVLRGPGACEAVIHLAAILPPLAETMPERAQDVNVGGTRVLLDAMSKLRRPPLLVFTSSIAVMGDRLACEPPRRISEEPRPYDHYGRQKLACEELVRESGVPWVITRVGACLDFDVFYKQARAGATCRRQRTVRADCRVEWVSPADVSRALANALVVPEAWARTLFLGGGPRCQIYYHELLSLCFAAMGFAPIPTHMFGEDPLHVDWMDTEESQRLLRYQRHDLGDLRAELARKLLPLRAALWPIRPLARRLALHL